MATQLAQSQSHFGTGKNSHVPGMTYAMDVGVDGHVVVDVYLDDIAGKNVGMHLCPSPFGAAVQSATGGLVTGYDYLGQYIEEDVAAATSSTIAFAGFYTNPNDLKWTNQIGLPYKRLDATLDGDGAFVDASDTGDSRGLFTPATTPDGSVVTIEYKADRSNLHGDPYADRFASEEFDTQTIEVTGTVDDTGLVTITVPATDPAVACKVRYPDGSHAVVATGGTVAHTLSPLWMEQYGSQISDGDPILDKLVTVDPLGNEYAPVYVNLSGSVQPDDVAAPAPPSSVTPPPASFATHVAADAWLDNFTTETGLSAPLDWEGGTLTEKHASAQTLYDEFTD